MRELDAEREAMLKSSAFGLDPLLANGNLAQDTFQTNACRCVHIAITIDSAESKKTHENRSTVERHGGR